MGLNVKFINDFYYPEFRSLAISIGNQKKD